MRLDQLNFNHLFYFWRVAKLGHLTQAAQELHTSQSAVSTQIRQLEERPAPTDFVTEGQILKIAGLTLQVIHTPGHTPGGVCYKLEPDIALFTGDTLFRGSAGRTDLPGGNFPTLNRSLQKLATLPDALPVYSGHGPATTIGHEKRHNIFLRA